ncbi:MAG: hypothetical protein ACTSYH_07635 [Candidatus Heimdallarchaeaceae archaeon]
MMNPREKALNKLINFNREGVFSVHPSRLKIDFFQEGLKKRIELGIAYLNKEIKKKYISSDITCRLDNIKQRMSVGILKIEEFSVDIMGVEDEEYPRFLQFSDGIHRTITALSRLNREDRYFDEKTETPIKELRKRAKEEHKNLPKVKKRKTNWKRKLKLRKTVFDKLIINEEPEEIPLFPEIQLLEDDE